MLYNSKRERNGPIIAKKLNLFICKSTQALEERQLCTITELTTILQDCAIQQDRRVFPILGNYPRKMLMGLYE